TGRVHDHDVLRVARGERIDVARVVGRDLAVDRLGGIRHAVEGRGRCNRGLRDCATAVYWLRRQLLRHTAANRSTTTMAIATAPTTTKQPTYLSPAHEA